MRGPAKSIDAADRLCVEKAALEATRATRGEIAITVVPESAAGRGVELRLGLVCAGLAFLGLAGFAPSTPALGLLGAQLGGLAGGVWLARVPWLRRRLVYGPVAAHRIAERALRAFAESGLGRSPVRGGILIFVSLLERRVVVLADAGIDAALAPDERWDRVVALVADGFRRGAPTDGLLAAIACCEATLRRHLPGPPRPVTELPAALRLEE
jgi:putative membrane protein